MCLVTGDFNARIGESYHPISEYSVLRNERTHIADSSLNPRGKMLLNEMDAHVF